jgi:hypothetical protein
MGPMAGMLAVGAAAAGLLGGCGGGTKTVTISAAPTTSTAAPATRRPAARRRASTATSAPATTPARPTAGQSAAAQGANTTRTAPEPAFTAHGGTSAEASGAEAAAAVAAVKGQGYSPNNVSEYHPSQTLRVLLGTRTGSADGYDQRAFFFLDGKYIGTDASQPSASIRVLGQSDTEVVLAYALYRSHDALCCPSGGQAAVHFQLNDGKLAPLQPIPPASSATGLSRQ